MGQTIFTGIATALITPFTETGVDYEAYGRLIDWQIASGIDALVAAGTSGEGSTLTIEEHKEVIRFTVARAAGRVPGAVRRCEVRGTLPQCAELLPGAFERAGYAVYRPDL